MSWILAAIYDRGMRAVERAGLGSWRADLLRHAEGDILEIGAGTGANLEHYPAHAERLTLAEPDPHMRRRLARRAGARQRTSIRAGRAERLPLDSESVDTVVSTLVLCSVDDLASALAEIRRVLRPGGKLLFLEHVAADPDSRRLRWQRRVEPLWKRMMGNCHLTRRTDEAIARAGLAIEQLERASMRKAVPLVRPTVRGIAVKR